MYEVAQGAASGLSLDDIARQDRERAAQHAADQQRTRRRHGNRGSRVWGYTTPSTGKRRRRSGK